MTIKYNVGCRILFEWSNDLGNIVTVQGKIVAHVGSDYEVSFYIDGEPTIVRIPQDQPNIKLVSIGSPK